MWHQTQRNKTRSCPLETFIMVWAREAQTNDCSTMSYVVTEYGWNSMYTMAGMLNALGGQQRMEELLGRGTVHKGVLSCKGVPCSRSAHKCHVHSGPWIIHITMSWGFVKVHPNSESLWLPLRSLRTCLANTLRWFLPLWSEIQQVGKMFSNFKVQTSC